jgi:hypothetical protein
MPEGQCQICKGQAEFIGKLGNPGSDLDWALRQCKCPRCGEYEWDSEEGWHNLNSTARDDHMVRLSAWVRQQNAAGVVPVRIDREVFNNTKILKLPNLRERVKLALIVIARNFPDLDRYIPIDEVGSDNRVISCNILRNAKKLYANYRNFAR